jgi:hypothetical protein
VHYSKRRLPRRRLRAGGGAASGEQHLDPTTLVIALRRTRGAVMSSWTTGRDATGSDGLAARFLGGICYNEPLETEMDIRVEEL